MVPNFFNEIWAPTYDEPRGSNMNTVNRVGPRGKALSRVLTHTTSTLSNLRVEILHNM